MRCSLSLFAAAVVLAGGLTARADTFSFSLSGASDTASGILTATATATPGQYLVTGITGTDDGQTITALLPLGVYPPDAPPEDDDLLFYPGPSNLYFDRSGISFTLADGVDVNLWGNGAFYYVIQGVGLNGPESEDILTSVSVAPTPEPSSLLLLGTGVLGALGSAARRRLA